MNWGNLSNITIPDYNLSININLSNYSMIQNFLVARHLGELVFHVNILYHGRDGLSEDQQCFSNRSNDVTAFCNNDCFDAL